MKKKLRKNGTICERESGGIQLSVKDMLAKFEQGALEKKKHQVDKRKESHDDSSKVAKVLAKSKNSLVGTPDDYFDGIGRNSEKLRVGEAVANVTQKKAIDGTGEQGRILILKWAGKVTEKADNENSGRIIGMEGAKTEKI